MPSLITASEAAQQLGVSKQTLYSYVSRGLIRTSQAAGDTRGRLYRAEDVAKLATRKSRGRKPQNQGLTALEQGWPLLETALSTVLDGELYYRGRAALQMAEQAEVEDVARWLWQFEQADPFASSPPAPTALWLHARAELAGRPLAERALALFTLGQQDIPSAAWLQQEAALAASCASLLRYQVAGLLGTLPSALPLKQQFAQAWGLDADATDLLRAILVLVADHQLNNLTFPSRCIAATGATLGHAMLAALCGVSGTLHGGAFAQVEAMWEEWAQQPDLARAVQARLDRGDPLHGFNHPAYPQGEPRARWLLTRQLGDSRTMALAASIAELTGQHPSLDFALVTLRRAMGWPPDAAFILLHAGRSIGVIAQILEQRRTRSVIRPSARYVGPAPQAED